MTKGQKIKQLRKEIKMSQTELAQRLETTKQTVSKYEKDIITNIPSDKIEAMAQIFGVKPQYLQGWEDLEMSQPTNPPLHPLPPMKQWQVIGATACGQPMHQEASETVLAPADIDADRVFRCVGDSMVGAHIFDGDLVFVKVGQSVENGKIGVVRVGEEYTLKRIYHGPDYLELRSENPAYAPIVIRGDQENAEIVGLAVQFLSRVV